MPPFPNVRSVEYDGEYMYRVAMKTMSTSLFPQVEELRLAGFSLESLADLATIVSRCGRLKSLSLDSIHVGQRESPVFPTISESTNPDLTTLEELVVKGLGIDPGNFIAKLLQQYPSHSLRTLAFNHCDENQACSVDAIEKLLQSFAPSLVNLVIDPSFAEIDDNSAMFGRLPVFSALESLTVWLEHSRCAEDAIRTLQAPNLTRLIFRLDLPYLYYDDVRDDFGELLEEIFPWNTSESVKATISRKFPSCRRIAFHFCIPKDSQMHYR
ncbi:hypothetical protein FB45DRAFT_907511 [Roridomyces roridus]|uniref:Uncharacterized protein n=1 Tax=Roridomyces roridus TaxID=1738132 RepID=A0AAD7C236_9AGAR|nr:hypothetical protein FB45DRAFT_907511 [Roridomyces roridus]